MRGDVARCCWWGGSSVVGGGRGRKEGSEDGEAGTACKISIANEQSCRHKYGKSLMLSIF